MAARRRQGVGGRGRLTKRQLHGRNLTPGPEHRQVPTAVARRLSKKITVDVRARSWSSKNTINTMVDQLTRSPEVTRCPRGGSEGKWR